MAGEDAGHAVGHAHRAVEAHLGHGEEVSEGEGDEVCSAAALGGDVRAVVFHRHHPGAVGDRFHLTIRQVVVDAVDPLAGRRVRDQSGRVAIRVRGERSDDARGELAHLAELRLRPREFGLRKLARKDLSKCRRGLPEGCGGRVGDRGGHGDELYDGASRLAAGRRATPEVVPIPRQI